MGTIIALVVGLGVGSMFGFGMAALLISNKLGDE